MNSGIFHGVLERFWLQPSLALCCIAGCGVGMTLEFLKSKAKCPTLKYLFLPLAVIAIGYQVTVKLLRCCTEINILFFLELAELKRYDIEFKISSGIPFINYARGCGCNFL
jgi:hypothetical protein